MSDVSLKYLLAMTIVVLTLVVCVLIQNWWDARNEKRK
jgi:ABC-type uncharacterized transport system permease subunit